MRIEIFMRRLLFAVMILMGCMEMAAQQDVQSSKTNTREYDVMLHEALLQRQKGHHDASFDLLCRCRELRPDASEVHYFIGQYYEGLGQKEQALASYQRASQLEPENITYLERLAGSYVDSNQYAEAIDVYKEALRCNPADDETRYNLEVCKRLYPPRRRWSFLRIRPAPYPGAAANIRRPCPRQGAYSQK